MRYLKQAIRLLRTNVLGLPPGEPEPPAAAASATTPIVAADGPQGYTQALLARFSLPSARWSGNAGAAGADFYNLLAGLAGAAASSFPSTPGAAGTATGPGTGTLIPPSVRTADRASFLATQRERVSALLSALDREAARLQSSSTSGAEGVERPPSGASGASGGGGGGLSKSRSEADFEKIDAESGAEELGDGDGDGIRRRTPGATSPGGGSWMPWAWGAGGGAADAGKSSGIDK